MTYNFDQKDAKKYLKSFFSKNKSDLNTFGSRVNQTFEAYVFAKVIEHYNQNGWIIKIINPNKSQHLKLKFSTRGAPIKYSYCEAKKDDHTIQIRHQLRVDIFKQFKSQTKPSNICCDIVVMNNLNLDTYSTNDSLPNDELIAFGEVKHMSAFAELVASFVGLVHELQPKKLKQIRTKNWKSGPHLSPFLYVSGILYSTAAGILESLKTRRYDIDLYSHEHPI